MFCVKCGHKIGETDGFCPGCGTKIVSREDIQSAALMECGIYIGSSEKKRLEVQELKRAREHFGGKKELYDLFHGKEKDYENEKGSHWYRMYLILSLVLIIPSLILLARVGGWVGLILPAADIFLFVFFFVMRKKQRREVAELKKELDDAWMQINEEHAKLPACPVPVEWSDPKKLDMLWWAFQANRADTIKEAINLCSNMEYRKQYESEVAQAIRDAGVSRGVGTAVGGAAIGAGCVASAAVRNLL